MNILQKIHKHNPCQCFDCDENNPIVFIRRLQFKKKRKREKKSTPTVLYYLMRLFFALLLEPTQLSTDPSISTEVKKNQHTHTRKHKIKNVYDTHIEL